MSGNEPGIASEAQLVPVPSSRRRKKARALWIAVAVFAVILGAVGGVVLGRLRTEQATSQPPPLVVEDITKDVASRVSSEGAAPTGKYGQTLDDMINREIAAHTNVVSAKAINDPGTGRRWVLVRFNPNGPLPSTLMVYPPSGTGSLEPVCSLSGDKCTEFAWGWNETRLPSKDVIVKLKQAGDKT